MLSCFAVLIVALFSSLGFAAEQSRITAPHLAAELISDHQSIAPNDSFKLGVRFDLEPGWHVYWKNSGDSGEPPKMDFHLSSHLRASPIAWPVPQRIATGPLVNYGYQNQILLPVTMQADAQLGAQDTKIELDLQWLVCHEECIPGRAHLVLPLEFKTPGQLNPQTKALFDATEQKTPSRPPSEWRMTGTLDATNFRLKIDGIRTKITSAVFYPSQTGLASTTAAAPFRFHDPTLELDVPRADQLGDQDAKALRDLEGVLVVSDGVTSTGYDVKFPLGATLTDATDASRVASALIFAFLGGLLLNLMPCVFPILSMKVMSVAKMSGSTRGQIITIGWAYTIGIIVSFWLLVAALLLLRYGGSEIGWGFQLQSPKFVLVLACLLFVFGLNLLGLFEVSGGFTGWGNSLTRKEGLVGSFFTGALAVLVATPCTAPFMGSAVGYALTQPSLVVFAVFTALAIGLAFPYLAACYVPSIGRFLPRPGRWMETFKEAMAFLLFATVLWLAWVLSLQASASGLYLLLCAFFVLGFATWIARRFAKAWLFAVVFGATGVGFAAWAIQTSDVGGSITTSKEGLEWEAFSPEKVEAYRAAGRNVFVDFTAAWCVSCKVNELLVFHDADVIRVLKQKNFALLKADWTNQDPVITRTLAEYGRSGVPFYLVYRKEKDQPALPLPEIITAGLVLKTLESIE